MARSVAEWVGKTDDAKVPVRVKLRIFERTGGVCHISGAKIRPGDEWDVEHVKPLWLGGEHRESNLAPALRSEHRKKTANEAKARAKSDSVRKRHLGLAKARSLLPGSRGSKWKQKVGGGWVRRGTE